MIALEIGPAWEAYCAPSWRMASVAGAAAAWPRDVSWESHFPPAESADWPRGPRAAASACCWAPGVFDPEMAAATGPSAWLYWSTRAPERCAHGGETTCWPSRATASGPGP